MTSDKTIRYFIRISIICVILLLIWDFGTPNPLTDITYNPLNTDWSLKNFDINSIIQTLLSASLGFLLSIVIIELVINKTREKEAEAKRESRLSAVISLLYIPFWEYARAAKCITNKITGMSKENGYRRFDESLTIPIGKDALLDIYKPALYVDKPFYIPKIEVYLDAVEKIQDVIRSILLNADLSNNPDESKLFIDYLNDTFFYLSASKKLIIERKSIEKDFELIGKVLDRPIKTIETNNYAYPFVALAELIEKHDEFFHAFLPEIQYKELFGIK